MSEKIVLSTVIIAEKSREEYEKKLCNLATTKAISTFPERPTYGVATCGKFYYKAYVEEDNEIKEGERTKLS